MVWWGSLIEVYSAICRLHRDKEISDLDKQGAVTRLALLDRGWREVLPNDQVRDLAKQSLDKYSLRAADSLQLAASLIWCRQGGISYAEITVWHWLPIRPVSRFLSFKDRQFFLKLLSEVLITALAAASAPLS